MTKLEIRRIDLLDDVQSLINISIDVHGHLNVIQSNPIEFEVNPLNTKQYRQAISRYVPDKQGDTCDSVPVREKELRDMLTDNEELEDVVVHELFKLRFQNSSDVVVIDSHVTNSQFNKLEAINKNGRITNERSGKYDPIGDNSPLENLLSAAVKKANWCILWFCEGMATGIGGHYMGVTVNKKLKEITYLDGLHWNGDKILASVVDFLQYEYNRYGEPFDINEWEIHKDYSLTMEKQLANSQGHQTNCGIYLFLMVSLVICGIPISVLKPNMISFTRLHLLFHLLTKTYPLVETFFRPMSREATFAALRLTEGTEAFKNNISMFNIKKGFSYVYTFSTR